MRDYDHGGDLYGFDNHEQLLDFSANINPLGMSSIAYQYMIEKSQQIREYPDPHNRQLKELWESHYDVQKESILFTNGASEAIYMLTALPEIEEVLFMEPTFSEYKKGAQAFGVPWTSLISYDQLVEYLSKEEYQHRVKLVFLGHPNNPTGTLWSQEEIVTLLELVGPQSFLVLDESFIDFLEPSPTFRPFLKQYNNLVIIHSMTKFFAIPGLRIGSLYGAPQLIRQWEERIPTWSVNRLSQLYMEKALEDISFIKESKAYMNAEKKRIYDAYIASGLFEVIEPTVNFFLVRFKRDISIEDLITFLQKSHILIRSTYSFSNIDHQWFRIAIKKREENDLLLEKLKEFYE